MIAKTIPHRLGPTLKATDFVKAYGHTMSVGEWSALEGAPPLRVLLRRLRCGVDPEKALVEKSMPEDRGRNGKRHSQYRGVTWHQGAWWAQIKINGRVKQVGPFGLEEDAARKFDELARKHGRRTNFQGDAA